MEKTQHTPSIVTTTWRGKNYTSQDRLNALAKAGRITKSQTQRAHGFGSDYAFSTPLGEKIATFYKDSTFGFCTQACGIELPSTLNVKEI